MSNSNNRTLDVFRELNKILNSLTKNGREFTYVLIKNEGTKLIFHTKSRQGVSLNRLGSQELSLLLGEGKWILTGQEVWVLLNHSADLIQDSIRLIERPKSGQLIITDLLGSKVIDFNLNRRTMFATFMRGIFDPSARYLLSMVNKIK